jgi:hypothetical protein
MWNTLVNISSVLIVVASWYTIYAIGASIYFLSWQPIGMAVTFFFIVLCAEVIFGALDT